MAKVSSLTVSVWKPKTLTTPPHIPGPKWDSDPYPTRYCPCGRRHLIGSLTSASLLPLLPSKAEPTALNVMEEIHPPRPDWYEQFYAKAMAEGMRSYEAEIAGYKLDLFGRLPARVRNVVELGVGPGPNFKYYANAASGLEVVGVDPNRQMERYARAAAADAGLPPGNFTFVRGVGEALPVRDDSVDAVIGTLVLCSVKDVDMALREVRRVLKPGGVYLFIEHVAAREGTLLRVMQSILDPLQQFVSDGCHLTRETGKLISEDLYVALRAARSVELSYVNVKEIIKQFIEHPVSGELHVIPKADDLCEENQLIKSLQEMVIDGVFLM